MNNKPTIIPQSKHGITPDQISKNARSVLNRLNSAGYEAYAVGGCIRDLLLKKNPKDFDIATNASPNQIKKLFNRCHLIGRRFRLAHIPFGREVIEVATFRASHEGAEAQHGRSLEGMIVRDNVYGTIEEDARRRDFTINALFYNIQDSTILDFANGFDDLQNRTLRILGDPETRYREDPVRMIRAARIAGKLSLTVEPATEAAILKLNHLLSLIPTARLADEVIKLFQTGYAYRTYPYLIRYGLLEILFHQTFESIQKAPETVECFLEQFLHDTDQRIQQKKSVSPFFIYVIFLWHPVLAYCEQYQEEGLSYMQAFDRATRYILSEQNKITALSHRLCITIRETWYLQHRLEKRRVRRILHVLSHARFRPAYDLLLVRAKASGNKALNSIATWWSQLQTLDKSSQQAMIDELETEGGKKPRAKRKRKSKTGRSHHAKNAE